jgi:protein SCO1/2
MRITRPLRSQRCITLGGLGVVLLIAGTVGHKTIKPVHAAEPAGAAPIERMILGGASFQLSTQDGTTFSGDRLRGRPFALLFGYTHCPDVCPTALLELSHLLAQLGPDGDRLSVVFVTVDPERDTPEQLRTYLSSFDPRIVGLTGSPDEIARVAKTWSVFFSKVPEDDGSYSIAHSAYVYLVDSDNRLADTMGFHEPEIDQLAKLKKLIRASSGQRK